jgi:pimeloyl-ACP methyl ester carboxylesterase
MPKTGQTPRLVLFPGLGMGAELYAPQRSLPARVEVVPWLRAQCDEPMGEYARRLAATVDPTGPLYLGGMSFGAMLALEAASILRPRGVFLIAGARTGRALSPLVRMTCRLTCRMPESVYAATLLTAPLLVRMVGRPRRGQRRFLLELARRSLPWLSQWGCRAMVNWSAPPDIGCPIHHIHGDDDLMIPLKNLHPPPDVIIRGGGHVIHVTHADVVNAFIAERLGVV